MTNSEAWWLTWPVAEVAAAILPYFSHDRFESDWVAMRRIVSWCKTGSYGKRPWGQTPADSQAQFNDPDTGAIAEAMQVLERAGLLIRSFERDGGSLVGLTRLGRHALQTNTVREHLA